MSFQPVVLGSGLAAWSFLKNTIDAQHAAHQASTATLRDDDYFRENIGAVTTAAQLVDDHRLLNVSLKAFGLSDDLPNKYFIRTVLEQGTLSTDALANKLADSRYSDLASAFGFGDFATPRTQLSDFSDEILERAHLQGFEESVGAQDGSLRLALYFERRLPEVVETGSSDDTHWFRIMGDEALRSVMETALGLPEAFGQLDIDKQLEVFQAKTTARFGVETLSEMTSPENLEEVVRLFLLREQVSDIGAYSPAATALALLQS